MLMRTIKNPCSFTSRIPSPAKIAKLPKVNRHFTVNRTDSMAGAKIINSAQFLNKSFGIFHSRTTSGYTKIYPIVFKNLFVLRTIHATDNNPRKKKNLYGYSGRRTGKLRIISRSRSYTNALINRNIQKAAATNSRTKKEIFSGIFLLVASTLAVGKFAKLFLRSLVGPDSPAEV